MKTDATVTCERASGVYLMPGMELRDNRGNRWIVVGVVRDVLGLQRSTWWRRLRWRIVRWLGR